MDQSDHTFVYYFDIFLKVAKIHVAMCSILVE